MNLNRPHFPFGPLGSLVDGLPRAQVDGVGRACASVSLDLLESLLVAYLVHVPEDQLGAPK